MEGFGESVRFDHVDLARWSTGLLEACGITHEDAEVTAAVLTRTNLRGIDTHGVMRLPMYVDKIISGEVNARPVSRLEVKDNVLTYDGDGGLGQAVMTAAVRATVGVARTWPATTCVVRRSGHLAAVGMFLLEAAEAGMVAVLCQETPPLMALPGSTGPAIGNNPIAFAAPVPDGPPLVFDMATSVVARGSVLEAVREGRPIPPSWALDANGEPTEDPRAALGGAMLPLAGHKGIGLAMLVQVLAGSLTGSASGESARKFNASSSAGNVSAFLLVIDPAGFVGRGEFDYHLRSWLEQYLRMSGPEARYPGQRAATVEAERARDGVPLSSTAIADLEAVGERAGHPFDVRPVAPAG